MKKSILLLLITVLFANLNSFSQGGNQIEQADFLKEKKTFKIFENYGDCENIKYTQRYKTKVLKLERGIDGKVTSFKLDQVSNGTSGFTFVPAGIVEFGDGQYTEPTSWICGSRHAIIYNKGIYFLGSYDPFKKLDKLCFDEVYGKKGATNEDLKDYIRPYVEARQEAENQNNNATKNFKAENTIKGKDVENIEIVYIKHPKEGVGTNYDIGYFDSFDVGVIATLENGSIIKTANIGGKGFKHEYDITFRGAGSGYLDDYPYKIHSHTDDFTEDYLFIHVESDYHDNLIATKKVTLNYDKSISLYYDLKSQWSDYHKGFVIEDLIIEINNHKHTENGNNLLEYRISQGNEYLLSRLRMHPDQLVKINNEIGGVKLITNGITNYNLKYRDEGTLGAYTYYSNDDTEDSYETDNTNTSEEFTIINESGTAIHLIDEGGNGQGSLNNGGEKTFDCDETIYIAHQNSGGTWNIKGTLIASGSSSCGKTVIYK